MTIKLPWNSNSFGEIWTWPQIICFNFYGFWTDNTNITKIRRRLLNCFRLYNIFSSIFMIISVVISTGIKFSNGETLDGLIVIFTVAPLIVAATRMLEADRHQEKFQVAMKAIDELNKNTKDQLGALMIKKTTRRSWIIFFVSISISVLACLHWLIRPIFYIVLYNEKTMVIDSWPKLTDKWILFISGYIYQFFLLCCLDCFYVLFDNLLFSISEFVMCHFEILEMKLKIVLNKKTHIKTVDLTGIVDVHVQLLEICKNLKAATDVVLVTQALITVSSYCVGLYIVTKENGGMNMVMSLAEAAIAVSVFLFLSCWYCNELSRKCGDFTTSAYMSEWTNWNQSQKKIILNLMTRTMSPVTFGGFLNVNLNTFINVLKTTFSYYNFLLAVFEPGSK